MLDFVSIETELTRNGSILYPEFNINLSTKDLMIRGKSFYAVWDEEKQLWSRNEKDVQRLVDGMIFDYAEQHPTTSNRRMKLMSKFSTNKWTEWQRYCKALPDNFKELDSKVIFSNMKVKRKDYATRTLSYPLEEGGFDAYDELMRTLYAPEERQKLEWAIGSIIAGDSKRLQKFIVLYGGPGTGKSTVLNIIQELFDGYYSIFDSKALGSANSAFALESFRENPLIAIQHDGDLSRIEDNTKLNSIVSHEAIIINEKFKATYTSKIQSFLFMGTNKPVRITDAKSGILRRLIDVSPTGEKIPRDRFEGLMSQIKFELPGIAWHCLEVYKTLGYKYYDGYIPEHMIGITNDFYNFIEDNYEFFCNDGDGITLKTAWLRYKEYVEDARVPYPLSMRLFRHELENYFEEFHTRLDSRRSVYTGFLRGKFQQENMEESSVKDEDCSIPDWLHLKKQKSLFDEVFKDCPAQYATSDEIPAKSWDAVTKKLCNLDTSKLHYIRPDDQLIAIDFDLKNEKGEKDAKKNLEAAAKWPKTYAELSKGGAGLHLCYYYNGDTNELSRIFSPDVEIKVFTGKSSLRRRLSKCNDIPIATISSGLPLKERKKKMLQNEVLQSERGLRNLIKRNLRKEIHPNTKPSIDFIYKILTDAYESGIHYDVEDLRPDVQYLALSSTHQVDYCMQMVSKMPFKSEEVSECVDVTGNDIPIVFFDVEVFPNLFVVCWKKQGPGQNVVKMINPTPEEVEALTKYRLVGFNNRKYDNHMLYARMMGYTEEQLYQLSQRIITDNNKEAFFGEAYNLSYTDIYDYLSAGNKMSLKKWEIKLGIHHQELGLSWNEEVPRDLWQKVADYCVNDVVATEAVWDASEADWLAREILSDLSGLTRNDTTNNHTAKIIVGNDRNPQAQFVYTDLSTIFPGYRYDPYGIPKEEYREGAKIVQGKSIYMGEDPGEGGRVFAKPGIYYDVAVLDITSMHPNSLIRLNLFGNIYTMRFKDLVDARILIKHKDFDAARKLLDGKLAPYLDDPSQAKKLANALKTAINSVYGLTSAKFPNKLRDPRNIDNIVAKYGALFMINLQHEVEKRGFTVVHIKTDSIKIANATPEIIQFVMDYGKEYGYTFEHESTYSKICLVNEAVYIAKVAEEDGKPVETPYWTATGTQFQVPYVFKTLFSKEKVLFEDICETKSVSTALYLDFNESLPDVLMEEQIWDIREKIARKPGYEMTKKEERLLGEWSLISDEELKERIAAGHDYRFVGKVGSFCPVKEGYGGGYLLREKDGKMYAATGTKKPDGTLYRWVEVEMQMNIGWEKIDFGYHNYLVNEAIEAISQYGDFEQFIGNDDGIGDWMAIPDGVGEEFPFPMNKPA